MRRLWHLAELVVSAPLSYSPTIASACRDWRSKNGSRKMSSRRRAASRGSPKAPPSRLRPSGCRPCRVSPSRPEPTKSFRRSTRSPTGAGRQCLRYAHERRRRREQGDRRHPTAADRRAARHPYRLESLPGAAWRTRRPRRLVHLLRPHQKREDAGDPRPSLEERYGNRDAYVAKIKAAAEALLAERLLLPDDVAAYVAAAKERDWS
jgi:hypothetical protein